MKPQKSFTLIELLVVISVIGLLSSIVLVSTKGIREKARIAKTLEFSQSVQSALGAEAVGIWEFDEGNGTFAGDSSGFGNNATIYGAVFTADTPQKIVGSSPGKYALSFDGTNDYVNVPNSASLNMGIGDFTVEYWMYYTGNTAVNNVFWAASKSNGESSTPGWISGITTYGGNGSNFKLLSSITNGIWGTGNLESGAYMSPNKWYHVVFTRAGTNLKHYRDGKLDGARVTAAVENVDNSILLAISGQNGGGPWFGGIIDEVRIYKQALTIGQIQKHYAEGLENHQLVKN